MAHSIVEPIFTWDGKDGKGYGGEKVFLSGSWDGWTLQTPLQNGKVQKLLQPGFTYMYRFIVDGKWRINPLYDTVVDVEGNVNNIITVPPFDLKLALQYQPPAYKLGIRKWFLNVIKKLPCIKKKRSLQQPLHIERTMFPNGELCLICLNKFPHHRVMRASCSHTYCFDCFEQYAIVAIEKHSPALKCPHFECEEHVNVDEIEQIARVVKQAYKLSVERATRKKEARSCPNRLCGAQYYGNDFKEQHSSCIKCGNVYCRNCLKFHLGSECDAYNEDDFMSYVARLDHYGVCPFCDRRIIRIDGCSSVRCACGELFTIP